MVKEVLSERVTFAQTPESQKPDEPRGTGAMEPMGYISSRIHPFTHLSIHLYSPLPPSTTEACAPHLNLWRLVWAEPQ